MAFLGLPCFHMLEHFDVDKTLVDESERRIEGATESTSGGISAIASLPHHHQTVYEKVAGDCTRK